LLLLLGVGFLGGLITGISPCIVPVLPIVVAGGSTSDNRRRPFSIIAGLIVSFSVFTLVGGELLSLLHLPKDLLHNIAIGMLFLLALGLLVPAVGDLLERPFNRLGLKTQTKSGSGFVLGASMGLVFVPCAGPVLAAITTVAATHRVGISAVLVTLAYAIGAAIPLLALTIVAQHSTTRFKGLRDHTPIVRRVAGGLLALTALAITFNWTSSLTALPGYSSALENHIECSGNVVKQLNNLRGIHGKNLGCTAASGSSLADIEKAPNFTQITQWLNTPGDKPLSLASLKGKVVLVDFWTYSCINCQRSLPHVEAWYRAYAKDGLVVVGVHTPEFPFEYVVSNVKAAAARLGVEYPIAIDDHYGTWDAYDNEDWPAEYLIDQTGEVRYDSFGEGDYATMEHNIRELLSVNPSVRLPKPTEVPNKTPNQETTLESYIGYERFDPGFYDGVPALTPDMATIYTLASDIPVNDLSFGGTWTQQAWSATAGPDAKLDLNFMANDVYLVLGGTGTVNVSLNGAHLKTIDVSGIPTLYTLGSFNSFTTGLLQLSVSPGVRAYDFTFG